MIAQELKNYLDSEIYNMNAVLYLKDVKYLRIVLPYNESKLREYVKSFGCKWNNEGKFWEGGSVMNVDLKGVFINNNMKKYVTDLKF
jgi:hypothetical protein